MATAPSLRAACDLFITGAALLATGGAWTSLEGDGEVTFRFEHGGQADSTRPLGEAMLLLFLRLLAEVSDTSLVPSRVDLAPEPGGGSDGLPHAAGPNVRYSAQTSQVTFKALQLERPPRCAHAGMHRYFAAEVRRALDELNAEADIVEALRRQLRGEAVLTRECLIEASSRLGVSARTLQRRLQLAGTSFTDELLTVRRERAHHLVAFSRRPLAKVACDLGFADRAAFSRAFRRWFDASPGRVRSNSVHSPAGSSPSARDSDAPRVAGENHGA